MAKFVVTEDVLHYHEVEIDDELDIDDIVEEAKQITGKRNTGYEALEEVLNKYKERYGYDFSIRANYCGTLTLNLNLEE